MKSRRNLSYLIIFGLFFSCGLWAGQKIGVSLSSHHPPEAKQPEIHFPLPQRAEETNLPYPEEWLPQRTILILGVDHLGGRNPRLEYAWLVMYLPGTPRLTVMPIHPPVHMQAEAIPDQQVGGLAASFGLTPEGKIDPGYTAGLQELGFNWDYYFIFDRVDLASLIDQLGGLPQYQPVQGSPHPGIATRGQLIAAQLPAMEVDGVKNIYPHLLLAQEICRAAGYPATLERINEQLLPTLLTDLDPAQAAVEINLLAQSGRLTCDFPSVILAAVD